MSFEIKQATRSNVILLFELWGGTGGGKTESALRLARGMAGKSGRVGIIDTEKKRSSYCLDRIPGGFERIEFDPPYTPERYIEALELLEKSADVGVLDSISHAWEGPDGILDLHEQALDKMTKGSTDYKERDRLNWPAWREPKARYKPLRNLLLNFRIPLIICARGDEKSHMEKGENGRNQIVTDQTTTPIFDKKFVFETHVAVEVYQIDGRGGYIRFPRPYSKVSHEGIRRILPESGKGQLGIEHGEQLARWCAGESTSKPAEKVDDELQALRDELKSLKAFPTNRERQQWLIDEAFIDPDRTLPGLTVDQLKAVIKNVRTKLKI